jgi:hypothetical protein
VVSDVAVEEHVADALLTSSGTALGLHVEDL